MNSPCTAVMFAVEPFVTCLSEMERLLPGHYAEIATDPIPLEIDFDKYLQLEQLGMLLTITARVEGLLVGYYLSIVVPHINHKSSLTGHPAMLYLMKPYRNGFALMRMVKAVEDALTARGAQRMFSGVVLTHDFGPLLERMGFLPVERMYSKMLGVAQ